MHRIDSAGNVSGMYTNGDPMTGQEATVVDADALNALQEEPCTVIEAEGITLVKGNNGQLLQALDSRFGRKTTANTWAGAQTFSAAVTAGGVLTANNGGPGLAIKPGNINHAYVEFFARTATPTTRSGFMGYGSAGSTILSFVNSLAGGDIDLTPGAGGQVRAGANLSMTGASPASTVGVSNALTPPSLPKAWGCVSWDSGTVTVSDGFNIASAAVAASNNIAVTFASPMANVNFAVTGSSVSAAVSTNNVGVGFNTKATTGFQFKAYDSSNTAINPSSSTGTVMFVVFGRQ